MVRYLGIIALKKLCLGTVKEHFLGASVSVCQLDVHGGAIVEYFRPRQSLI